MCGNGKRILLLSHVLGGQDMDGHCLEAEVRSELTAEAVQTQADQLGDMLRIPTRRGESQIQRYSFAIQLEQQQS